MTMITRTIRSLEAQQIIKDALAANSVEMQIEEQDGSHYVKYIVQTQAGQVAYSAYWRYRKEGALVLERQPCRGERSIGDRYAELRKLVEAWQHWQREPRYDQADAPERLMDWSHR